MINRFKEMIDAGVAKAKYNTDFCAYENNLYHSDNAIVRYYNAVWGALTDTNMRYNKLNDSYIITGRYIATGKFDALLDMDHYGTTWFITSFPGEDIQTLRDFFEHFGLCGARCVYNGEVAFVLTGKQTTCDEMKDIISSYQFGDESILPCGGETVCSEKTLKKYTDYCLGNEEKIQHYCCSVCNGASEDCEKLCSILGCLFPFATLDADYYKTYRVVRANGIGDFTLDGCCLCGDFVDGKNCNIDLSSPDFLEKLVDNFGFLKASL